MHEKRPQVLAAALGDTHHHFAIATRMLAWYQPQPGCEVAAVLEVGSVADCRYHRGCCLRSYSADLANPLANVAGLEDRGDLAIKGFDAFVDLQHEGVEARNDLAQQLRKLVTRRGQDLWNESPCPCSRYRVAIPRSSGSPRIWLISAVR